MNYSKQRSLILSILSSSEGHLTADEVYNKAREVNERISLGTVYRNLNALSEVGEIRRINIPGANTIFDKNAHKHLHFRCIKCGKIQDLSGESINKIVDNFEQKTGNKVYSNDIVLNGLCKNCKTGENCVKT